MKTFTEIHFRTAHINELTAFYCTLLGMTETLEEQKICYAYGRARIRISFEAGDYPHWDPQGDDFYWKIGITVKNLDAAVQFLLTEGCSVSEPRQFQEIGYLCHLQDPAGNSIELLQQGFEGREGDVPEGHPIGSQATLAHITLRLRDIEACRPYLEGELGLRLMSVQPVSDYGFTLYFFTWSEEPLPNPDLKAIENREWLWARPYPLLELQHLHREGEIRMPEGKAAGFAALSFSDGDGRTEIIDIDRLS